MGADRRNPDPPGQRPTPYPAWAAIAAELRRVERRDDTHPTSGGGKGWHDLLADDPSTINRATIQRDGNG